MKYGYEVQQDGTKTVHVFPHEATRAQWIATGPSARGVLSGNSKEAKAAIYRGTVIFESMGEREAVE
ncbi:MAG: hypothetical protein WCA19_24110 [Candidatus Acidiferrales bacterium]